MRMLKWLVAISSLCGLGFGGVMMYVAWHHNPQCSIHCSRLGVSWGNWLFIGISWAVPTFVVAFMVLGALVMVGYTLRSGVRRGLGH